MRKINFRKTLKCLHAWGGVNTGRALAVVTVGSRGLGFETARPPSTRTRDITQPHITEFAVFRAPRAVSPYLLSDTRE